jgi:hypothetical protein
VADISIEEALIFATIPELPIVREAVPDFKVIESAFNSTELPVAP